jgi:hypothetical protein
MAMFGGIRSAEPNTENRGGFSADSDVIVAGRRDFHTDGVARNPSAAPFGGGSAASIIVIYFKCATP